MAIKVFHRHNAAALAFNESERLLGVLEPGRYRGYETFTYSTLLATFAHPGGIVKTASDNSTTSSPTAVAVTRQGVIIHDDSTVDLTFDTNSGNASARIDVVYMEHNWGTPTGDPTYGIIKGSLGSEVEPSLSDPATQIKLGTMRLPANAANLSAAIWTPAETPNLGNKDLGMLAYLDMANEFTQLQNVKLITGNINGSAKTLAPVNLSGESSNVLEMGFIGGTELGYIVTNKPGTLMVVNFTADGLIKTGLGSVPSLYKNITVPGGADLAVKNGDTVVFMESASTWKVIATSMGANTADWTFYTTTDVKRTSGSMTLSSGAASFRYMKIGKTVHFQASISIIVSGGLSNDLTIRIPAGLGTNHVNNHFASTSIATAGSIYGSVFNADPDYGDALYIKPQGTVDPFSGTMVFYCSGTYSLP